MRFRTPDAAFRADELANDDADQRRRNRNNNADMDRPAAAQD